MMHMGTIFNYPGAPDPKTMISAAAAVSAFRNSKMKKDGLTRGEFSARRSRAKKQAKLDYKASPERIEGMPLEAFFASRLRHHDQQTVDDLVVYRKFPDQLWAAIEAGTLKLYYIDMSSLDAIAQGPHEAHGLNSRKEFLQAAGLLRLDPKVSFIVFHLARRCRTYFAKADFEMWLANAVGKNDDAISQATEALSIELTANLEMPKDDAREFVSQNFPSVSKRRFAGEVWPNAREASGLARMGRPGPKRKSRLS